MAVIAGKPDVRLIVTLALNEDEARALDAIVGYGSDNFIDAFYKQLGRSYLEKHEAGLRTLFDSVREHVGPLLSRTDSARAAFHAGTFHAK